MHGSRSKLPSKKSRPYIHDVKFLTLIGAPYIYDISGLRVKVIKWEEMERIYMAQHNEKWQALLCMVMKFRLLLMQRLSRPAEKLIACQEGFCCMESFDHIVMYSLQRLGFFLSLL
jgi:hypothetical protein